MARLPSSYFKPHFMCLNLKLKYKEQMTQYRHQRNNVLNYYFLHFFHYYLLLNKDSL